jgi:hypothetical protein
MQVMKTSVAEYYTMDVHLSHSRLSLGSHYLGSIIKENGGAIEDVDSRIKKGQRRFHPAK